MKQRWILAGVFLLILGIANAHHHSHPPNPFLRDERQSVEFRGVEWNDEYAPKDIPLSVQVVTEPLAETSWGWIFKISFKNLQSKASKEREIPALYFVATPEVIALLNEEKITEAVGRIAALEKPPVFEDGDLYGISSGSKKFANPPATTTIKTVKDTCTYLYSHESGHFTKLVWKKGVGLMEYGQGYGAHQDGFRLKRVASKAGR